MRKYLRENPWLHVVIMIIHPDIVKPKLISLPSYFCFGILYQLMLKLAHITSKYRSLLIANTYKSWIAPQKKVLDIGCGNGVVSLSLQEKLNISVTGCDVITYVSKQLPYIQMSSEDKLPFGNKTFDVAMFNDVLHHMPKNNQKKLLAEAFRVASVVVIFEVQPTLRGKIFDFLLNKIHHMTMRIPFTFRTISGWTTLFDELRLSYKVYLVPTPVLYPFSHVAFQLKKKY